MANKRILVVSQHYQPENFRINDIVPKLVDDGFDVDVLCGLPNYPEGEWTEGYSLKGPFFEQQGTISVYRAKEIPRKGNTSIRIFLNYVSWPIWAWFKAGTLPRDYDVVFCYNTSPVLMCWPANKAARLSKARLVTYVLDIWPENLYTVLDVKNKTLRNIATWFSNRAYSRADVLVTMSGTLREVLQKRLGGNSPRIEVIPQHAEDFYSRSCAPNQFASDFGKDASLFVFAGNFSPAQNLEDVIKAIVQARAASGKDLRLLLVGDGMSRDNLERLVDELGAGEYIKFYGRVQPEEIPSFSEAADAMLVSLGKNPALDLVIPAKVASCMAVGKPIIGFLDGEGAKAINDARCGYVAPAGSIDDLQNAFVQFAETSEEQKIHFGRNAYRYYERNFSRDNVIGRLEALFG